MDSIRKSLVFNVMLGYRKQKVKMTTEVQYDRSFIWIWIILELQICKQNKIRFI